MTKVKSERRNPSHGRLGRAMTLTIDHRAVAGSTSLFPNRVTVPDPESNLFKSGKNNRKIGSHVTKGPWAGIPIYTLTLEERATCPTVCEHWRDCYGNHMQWPTRWKAGPELETVIPGQLQALAHKHPGGFVVRLHVLGDFYSTEYVGLWSRMLKQIP